MGFWSNIGDLVSNTVEFVNENKGKIAGLTVGLILAPATGGTSLALCAGFGFMAGAMMDSDMQKRESENKKLALAGKAGQAIQSQVNNLQEGRNKVVQEAEELNKEVQKHKSKLNDPNTTKEEKELAKKMIPIIQNQLDEKSRKVSDYDRKIDDLLKNIPDGTDKGGGLGKIDPQTKLIIGAIIFLVIYFTLIKDKER